MELEDICKRLNTDIIASEIVSRGDEPNGKKKALKQVSQGNVQVKQGTVFKTHEYNSWYTV